MEKRTLIPLLVCAICTMGAGTAWAQLELLVVSPEQTAAPGDFVTIVFEVVNRGASPESFDLELVLPEGLSALAAPGSIALDPGASDRLFVTVAVSARARAGENRVTLRAAARGDPTIRAEATAIILVEEVLSLVVTPAEDRAVEPGTRVALTFRVTNLGNVLDRLILMAESLRGFPLELAPTSLEVLPGETRSVEVGVIVPQGAAPGRERVTLVARSTVFDVAASAATQLTILPPSPEEVSRALFLEVPSTLAFALSGSASTPPVPVGTLAGDATFGEREEIDYRLQIAGLSEVREMRFELERARYGVTLGDLDLQLSHLIGVDGRGLRIAAKRGPADATRVTLASALDPDGEWTLGTRGALEVHGAVPSLSARFRPARDEVLAGVALDAVPLGAPPLAVEGAVSRDASTLDRALLVRGRFTLADLEIAGEAIRAGSDFLGIRTDESGVSLSQSLNLGRLSLRSRFSQAHDNVEGDPARPTTTATRAQAAVRLPLGPLPTVSAQFDYRSEINAIPPVETDLREFTSALRLTERLGPLTLSTTYERRRSRDLVAGTDLERTRWRSDADVRIDPLLALFRIEHVTQRDLTRELVVDRFLTTLVRAELSLPPVELAFNVERLPEVTSLGARIEAELGRFTVTSAKDLLVAESGAIRFHFAVAVAVEFDVPIPFIKTRGQVEGAVFLDENANGTRDAGERGVPRLLLTLDGVRARTDESGLYRFPPLVPGRYELDIENLPAELSPRVPLPLEIDLEAGEVERVELPVLRIATIRGVVFDDANGDGRRDPGERGLRDVRVLAGGPAGEQRSTETSGDGSFRFAGLAPGRWRVAVDVTTLPERFELVTPAEVTVELGPGEVVDVAFGAAEQPEVVTFSPTADFAFVPERPVAGEEITFDGSLSFDPDGEIVKYEWDFDGDGETDATGPRVTFTFAAPGRYEVRLTVTDDDGLTGSVTRPVIVSAP